MLTSNILLLKTANIYTITDFIINFKLYIIRIKEN